MTATIGNFTVTNQCAGEIMQFNNISCGADANVSSWQWDFGDGAKSTEAHASHTYNNAGVYTVKLSVMSMNSKKMDELTQSITIN